MLGGNVGDRMDFLRRAVDLLRCDVGRVVAMSAVYESEPWGFDDPCWFLNQVAVVETSLAPLALLESIQQIEQTLGRHRSHDGYQPRTMDIDILLYGNQIINLPDLVIPHPRMTERMFVLQPMAELAPELEHPVLHSTMKRLREQCRDMKQVKLINNSLNF
jgi:2-amino-4-hydroxy-6-hydroxymethyldihydropteridine diphosphokinase